MRSTWAISMFFATRIPILLSSSPTFSSLFLLLLIFLQKTCCPSCPPPDLIPDGLWFPSPVVSISSLLLIFSFYRWNYMEIYNTGSTIPAPEPIFVGPSHQDFCSFAILHHIWSLFPWENMEVFCPNKGREISLHGVWRQTWFWCIPGKSHRKKGKTHGKGWNLFFTIGWKARSGFFCVNVHVKTCWGFCQLIWNKKDACATLHPKNGGLRKRKGWEVEGPEYFLWFSFQMSC